VSCAPAPDLQLEKCSWIYLIQINDRDRIPDFISSNSRSGSARLFFHPPDARQAQAEIAFVLSDPSFDLSLSVHSLDDVFAITSQEKDQAATRALDRLCSNQS
jgi:hypothetical protein